MAHNSYTLIVVPHAKAKFRQFQVSARTLRRAGWTAGGLALVFSGILVHYAWLSVNLAELRGLRVENAQLRDKTKEYEENAGRLQQKLEQLQKVVNKLGVMAGVDQTLPQPMAAAEAGQGGVSSLETRSPSSDEPSFAEMDRSVSSLTERSAKLEEFYRDQTILLSSTPSVWPVRGYLSSAFGNRADPFTGQKDFHPGIDISTPRGTKVQTPADGIVISCGPKGAYGNAIIMDHGYGIVTRYAHLDAFNVKPGQRVRRGDVIGFVGNSGRSTAPHLHYEVWVHDQLQNPIHFILDEYRSFG